MIIKKQISGWGRYPLSNSNIIRPKNIQECRNTLNKILIPRGMGRSYGDSAINNTVLETNYLDNLLNLNEANGILTCSSGISLNDILNFIVPKGWFIPVSPGTSYATIGGAIASDVHGKNHHHSGTLGKYVLSIKLMLGNGEVVEINQNYLSDLFYATCGGMGLTGLILEASLKLLPIKSSKINQTKIRSRSLEETCDIFKENEKSTYSVAWLDCLGNESSKGKGIIILGEHDKNSDLKLIKNKNFNIGINFPSFFINKFFISIFNKINHASCNNNSKKVDLFSYFYPLDKITNWNRLYGKKGFIQYQFVIPADNAVKNIKLILKKFTKLEMYPILSVLKKFGKQNKNLLSFPMLGYTLALDFKYSNDISKKINQVDEIIADMGGKIYLTKDALMSEKIFKKTYKKWEEFETIREKYGALNKFQSYQSIRLGLK